MSKLVNVSSDTSLSVLDDGALVLVDASGGAVVVTLPHALEVGTITIKKTDTSDNAVTVQTKGTFDRIEGLTSHTISEANNAVTLVSDRATKFYIEATDKYKVDYRLVIATGPITSADYIVGVSGSAAEIVVTLPSASVVSQGRKFVIHGEATAASALVVSGAGADTIDGVVAKTISQVTGSLVVYSNGTKWRSLVSDKL